MCLFLGQFAPEERKRWDRIAFCGICAAYVRPFLKNNGLGPLSGRYAAFDDPDQKSLHNDLMNGRHWLFAHRDVLNASKLVDPTDGIPIGEIDVVLEPGKGPRFLSPTPVIQPGRLEAISALCATQEERIRKDVNETIRLLTQGKRFKPGRYRLGGNFP